MAGRPLIFGHGCGVGQYSWRSLAPAFAAAYRTVTFDHAVYAEPGVDRRHLDRYGAPAAYADEVRHLRHALDLDGAVYIGHSVGGIIGMLAANAEPDRFAGLVLIGSSPRYIDDDDYLGGYTADDIADLLEVMDGNIARWFTDGSDSGAAREFARATFLSDHRADLAKVTVPTLILQGAGDNLVPRSVGEYLARHIPESRYEPISAGGHLPHLTAPGRTAAAIHRFLDTLSPD